MRTKKLVDSKSIHSDMLASLIRALEECDSDTEHHVRRTQIMGAELGKRIELSDIQQSRLSLLCLLHDIGKIGVPMEILNKPGKLTDEEWKIMRSHVEKGYDIANSNVELKQIAEEIRHHHERWDGKGYPDGLKGEEIPISAQVVSIVDVYDALTSERCYKKAFEHDTAIQMIMDGQCGQFNPILLKCLKELSIQLSKMLNKEMDDNKYSHEIQRLSNEILSDKSLPNQIYSQNLIKVMQEKIDFFKSNSGINSIDYNASSGQLTIINEKQKIIYQREDPGFDVFKVFE